MILSNCKNRKEAKFGFRQMANFRICATIITIAISMALISCGKDDNTKKDDDDNKKDDSELTATNWQKTIKDVYEFDLTVPEGWTFSEGKIVTANTSYDLRFTTENEFKDAYAELLQYIFDLTEAVVPEDGNFDVDLFDGGGKLDRFEEIPTMMGEPLPIWYFNTPSYCVQISLDDAPSTKTVQIYLFKMGAKK